MKDFLGKVAFKLNSERSIESGPVEHQPKETVWAEAVRENSPTAMQPGASQVGCTTRHLEGNPAS